MQTCQGTWPAVRPAQTWRCLARSSMRSRRSHSWCHSHSMLGPMSSQSVTGAHWIRFLPRCAIRQDRARSGRRASAQLRAVPKPWAGCSIHPGGTNSIGSANLAITLLSVPGPVNS
jgi:hypothetical protein